MTRNGPGRPPKDITLQRERDAWRLRQRGWSLARIADALGISEPSVWKIINRVAGRYHAELGQMVASMRRQQLAQLEYIADEALQAWELSKKETRTTMRRKRQTDGTVVDEAMQKEESRLPDIRFLQEARAALADMRTLLGVDAPARAEVTHTIMASAEIDVQRPADEQSSERISEIIAALAESGALQVSGSNGHNGHNTAK